LRFEVECGLSSHPPERTRRRCPTLAWCARVFLVCPVRGPGLPGGSPWEAGVTIPLRPALASQVWAAQTEPRAAPALVRFHLGPGLCLPACQTACQIAHLLQFGNGAAAISLHAATKVSLTITHRVFQPKVMQRTDCGLSGHAGARPLGGLAKLGPETSGTVLQSLNYCSGRPLSPSPARGRPIRGAIDNYVGCASFFRTAAVCVWTLTQRGAKSRSIPGQSVKTGSWTALGLGTPSPAVGNGAAACSTGPMSEMTFGAKRASYSRLARIAAMMQSARRAMARASDFYRVP